MVGEKKTERPAAGALLVTSRPPQAATSPVAQALAAGVVSRAPSSALGTKAPILPAPIATAEGGKEGRGDKRDEGRQVGEAVQQERTKGAESCAHHEIVAGTGCWG